MYLIALVIVVIIFILMPRLPCGCPWWCACCRANSNCNCKLAEQFAEPFIVNSGRMVTYHYTNWCVRCQKMRTIWDQVKMAIAGPGIEFREVDEDLAKTPGINEYPTIIMITETGRAVKYKGEPDFVALRNWIVSPLPYEY